MPYSVVQRSGTKLDILLMFGVPASTFPVQKSDDISIFHNNVMQIRISMAEHNFVISPHRLLYLLRV